MAGTDWDFVFDGVFGFLISPMWQVPVMTFIENSCEVFDPNEEQTEIWSSIHSEYRKLVEGLLSSYLKDVGITEEQFVQACSAPAARERPQMQVVFEQIWAGEDYEIFRRLMIQRNIELQLQALQLIQERHGVRPQEEMSHPITQTEEDEILNAVLRRSKEEYEISQGRSKQDDIFNAELEKVLAKSDEDARRLKEAVEKQTLEKKEAVKAKLILDNLTAKEAPLECKKPELEVKKESRKKDANVHQHDGLLKTTPPLEEVSAKVKSKATDSTVADLAERRPELSQKGETKSKPSNEAASLWLKSAQEDAKGPTSSTACSPVHSEDEMKKREDYLKQQRDRLLALKKNEREKRLNTFTKAETKRPASARAAREAVAKVAAPEQPKNVTVDDPKKLAMRKALAERLKKEVVDKQDSW